MTGEHQIRPAMPADEGPILALLQASLGGGPIGERTGAFFAWKHHDNPFGASYAFVATDGGGGVIGFRTFMRWRWRTASRSWEAVRAVDTATHPDHRGAGIFRSLTLHAVDRLRDEGVVDLIFNTPNDQSRPGYLKMGWTEVGTVPVAVRPVRPLRFLGSQLGRSRRRPEASVDCPLPPAATAFDHPDGLEGLLTAGHGPDDRLATDRSLAYLRWRYAEAPGLDYRVVVLGRADAPDGVAFGRPRRRGGRAELTLSELVVADGDGRALRALGLLVAAQSGCDHVATVAGPDPSAAVALRKAAYLAVPGRGITLTSRPLRAVRPAPVELASWRFSLGDLELF